MYNTLRTDLKDAMINKNDIKKNTIKNIMNKAQSIAKDSKSEVTDDIVYLAAQKEVAQLKDTLSYCEKDTDRYNECIEAIDIVNKYLPKMATADDVLKYLHEHNPKNIGEAMKGLKNEFGTSLNGKEASKIVKEFLS